MITSRGLLSFVAIFYFSHIVAQNTIEFSEIEQEWIREHPVVHFGFDPNWPPFEMYENGEYTGIIADYISVIEQKTGIDMEPVQVDSFNQTLNKLKSGEIHVAPEVGKNNSREKYLSFTDPYLSDPQVIVTRIKADFVGGLKGLEGKTVSQPAGYSRIERLKNLYPKIKIITTKDVKESLLDVSVSKADAFVGSLSVVSYYINVLGYTNLKIASATDLGDIKFRLAVTKDWEVFRDIAQKVFSNMTKDEHVQIRNEWISLRYEHGVDKYQLRNYIVYAEVAFLLLALFFYIWNFTLRKQIRIRKKVEEELILSLDLIKEKNKEKDSLVKEVHHRVKNNLQIVYSMLNMQSRQIDNKSAKKVLSEGKNRVMAMALIHKVLYESENLDQVNISDYIKALLQNISSIYHNENKNIEVQINAKNISLNLDSAIPLGLILSELLTNSYKHAFIAKDSGCINISIEKKNEVYYFRYKDNGVGLQNYDINDYRSLGMRLVKRLSNQLDGEAVLKSDDGVEVTFNFK